MKKYIALYLAPVSAMEQMMKNSSPEDRKKGMEAWMGWAKGLGSSMVELGTPLGHNKKVTPEGVSDTKNDVCGYSIVEAESHDAATEFFKNSPHLQIPGASVDVLECMSMNM